MLGEVKRAQISKSNEAAFLQQQSVDRIMNWVNTQPLVSILDAISQNISLTSGNVQTILELQHKVEQSQLQNRQLMILLNKVTSTLESQNISRLTECLSNSKVVDLAKFGQQINRVESKLDKVIAALGLDEPSIGVSLYSLLNNDPPPERSCSIKPRSKNRGNNVKDKAPVVQKKGTKRKSSKKKDKKEKKQKQKGKKEKKQKQKGKNNSTSGEKQSTPVSGRTRTNKP